MQKVFILIIIYLFSSRIYANDNLAKIIEQKIQEADPNINIGIKITNLDTDKIIYEKNADRYYTFASAIKFITITSLLEYFGPDYKFTSRIYKNGDNYYLDINDPDFSTADLETLLNSLSGIKTITGNFYIVQREFLTPPLMRTKTMSDNLYCYGAPITKVHINKNCSKLIATPHKPGEKITVKAEELVPYQIVNKAITIPDNKWDRLYTSIKDDQYVITGTLNNVTGTVPIGVVINDNFAHVKYMLKDLLTKSNITLKGKILYAKLPKEAKTLTSKHKSFTEVASVALKKSDNFITDYLLAEYATGQEKSEWEDAALLLKELVKDKFNVDLTKSSINDGSGISRYNLFTVNQFASFLKNAPKKPNFTDILNLMAKPEEDTALKERFKNNTKLYAKSGGLTGIVSLVGYFYDKNNKLHSFVIAINNIYGDKTKYIKLEDDIIEAMATN